MVGKLGGTSMVGRTALKKLGFLGDGCTPFGRGTAKYLSSAQKKALDPMSTPRIGAELGRKTPPRLKRNTFLGTGGLPNQFPRKPRPGKENTKTREGERQRVEAETR